MSKKEIARAKFIAPPGKSDVEAAWTETLSWYAKLKFGGAALSKPDFNKIRAAMEEGKRDLQRRWGRLLSREHEYRLGSQAMRGAI